MAKKSKPVKKASAKKSAPKKKTAPAKKPIKKQLVKKAKPVKKVQPKKAVKAKKAAPKKVAKPAKVAKPTKKVKAVKPTKAVKVVKATKPVKPAKVEKPEKAVPTRKSAAMAMTPAKKLSIQSTTFFPSAMQRPVAHTPHKSKTPKDKTHYNDQELKEFETLILSKLENAREEYRILKDTLTRSNDEGTDATSGGNTKVLEDGAETAEKENLSQLASRQLKYITNLENALIRIKNKSYGICTVTGKLIPKERLIAVPHTTQSIEAKMMQQE